MHTKKGALGMKILVLELPEKVTSRLEICTRRRMSLGQKDLFRKPEEVTSSV